jgi:hypothetical protein
VARTNVLTTAKRIRRHLRTGYRNEQTTLNGAIDASTNTLVLTTWYSSLQAGVTLGIDTELVRIVSINAVASTITVLRGYLDSDPATHADKVLVDIAPRFSLLDVTDAMQSEIASWGQRLYRVEDQTLTVATGSSTLELPVAWTDILGVVSVNQNDGTTNTVWPQIGARLLRGTPTGFNGASTSGALLRFVEPIRTGGIHVVVALAFDSTVLADPTKDLITDAKLTPGLIDVLELGTQRRVVAQDSDNRGSRSAQDEPRRAEETPAGSLLPTMGFQNGLYQKRIVDEVGRLRRRHPIRMTG